MLTLVQLIAAHVVADFVLQSERMALHKRDPKPLLQHVGVHFLCSCAFVNLGLSLNAVGAIAVLAAVHAFIDYQKARLEAHGWVAFVVDQAMHGLTIGAVALSLSSMSWSSVWIATQAVVRSPAIYLIVAPTAQLFLAVVSWCRKSQAPFSPALILV